MYGRSVAVGALALTGAARAGGLNLDLDLGGGGGGGGGAPDLARCAEDKCYGGLVRADVTLDVIGLCAGLFAVVDVDLSALGADLAACVSLDVLFAACQCIADGGGPGSGSGSGGAATTTESRAFPVITMTGGDGMATQTGGDGMATSQTSADGMASMTASMTAILTSSAATTVTPTASHEEHLTVSTVTTTKWHSVVDCPTTVTDCPAVTSQVEVYTTTCPVSGPHATAPVGSGDDNNNMPGGGNMPGYTLVKTLYSTNWHTVTKCSETISNCPATMTSEVQPTGYVTLTYPAVPTLTAVPVPGVPGNGATTPAMPGGGSPSAAPGYPVTNGTLPKPPPSSSHGTGAASPPRPTMPAGGGGGGSSPGHGTTSPIPTAGAAARLAGSGLALAAAIGAAAPFLL